MVALQKSRSKWYVGKLKSLYSLVYAQNADERIFKIRYGPLYVSRYFSQIRPTAPWEFSVALCWLRVGHRYRQGFS